MAEDYPKTLLELERRFATDEQCRAYLVALRWPEGFVCGSCGADKAWAAQRGRFICAACRHPTTVNAGTIFQDSHLPLRLWFRAIWQVISHLTGPVPWDCSVCWVWAAIKQRGLFCTSCAGPWCDPAGINSAVESRWMKLKRRSTPGRKGRGVPSQALVVIAAQEDGRGIGRIRLARIPDGSAKHLHQFIQGAIVQGSCVHTDGWKPYQGLEQLGYQHEVSKLKGQEISAATELLPRVHRVAALLKRWLLGTHQGAIAPEHLDYYLDEFTFRFNRRTSASRGKLFYRLAQQAVQVSPVPYKVLVGGANNPKHHP